jgi:hypothetical protein
MRHEAESRPDVEMRPDVEIACAMTVRPENRFTCNRCSTDALQAIANTPPHQRQGGPDGWLVLIIGNDPSTPPSHLCPDCSDFFQAFMINLHGEGEREKDTST